MLRTRSARRGWHASGRSVRTLATVALRLSAVSSTIVLFAHVPWATREILTSVVLPVSKDQPMNEKYLHTLMSTLVFPNVFMFPHPILYLQVGSL